jgi:hypothetical protein
MRPRRPTWSNSGEADVPADEASPADIDDGAVADDDELDEESGRRRVETGTTPTRTPVGDDA